MHRQTNLSAIRLLVAIFLGLVAVVVIINVVVAQMPSEIALNREPVEVFPDGLETIDWTITFTNTPISYTFSIYDPFNALILSTEFSVESATSPITGTFVWPVPTDAIGGPYLAEVLFYTEEISDPFDSQAAVTFLVVAPPITPTVPPPVTPILTPTPPPPITPILTPTPSTPGPSCTGNLDVYKCEDKNANGICREPLIDRPLPGVEVCLDPPPNGQAACQPTGEDGYARWQNLSCGSYVVTEHLTGLFRGYYPSSPMTQDVEVNENETIEVTFSNVFPLIPRGIAVNSANDKVYAAFQGIKESDGTRPYSFVAVIDSHTDQVIATIPNVGQEPFGVAVANNKVYVASFREGLLSVIDSQTEQIVKTITGFVNPTRLAADPPNNLLYVADHGDGRVHIIDTTNDTVIEHLTVSGPTASDPYDVAVSNNFAYTTLRDAPLGDGSNPFFLKATQYSNQLVSIPLVYQNQTGSPHAIAAQTHGTDTYLYITYAKDFRNAQPPYEWPPDDAAHPTNNPVNPTHLTVVEIPDGNPEMARRLGIDLPVGDFAEIGLIHNPNTNHLLGTYGGGFFEPAYPDQLACALIPKDRAESGSAYVLDATTPQNPQLIDKPTPGLRVGNSVAPMTGDFWWRNPFDIAVNPNNNKVYVTDRCWHDYDDQYDNLFPDHELWHDGGGAVFVFNDDSSNPHPPTATPTLLDEVSLLGQVNLQGRGDSQGATVAVDNEGETKGSVSTDASGYFRIGNLSVEGELSVTADAPAYLPAVCTGLWATNPEINLGSVILLSGDLNDDDKVDIFDMVMVGSHYGQTGPDLLTDINHDGSVDIFDLILVGKNSDKGAQVWDCS